MVTTQLPLFLWSFQGWALLSDVVCSRCWTHHRIEWGDENQSGWFLAKLPSGDLFLMLLIHWFLKAKSPHLSPVFMWSLFFLHNSLTNKKVSFFCFFILLLFAPTVWFKGWENKPDPSQWMILYSPHSLSCAFYCSCTKIEFMASSALVGLLIQENYIEWSRRVLGDTPHSQDCFVQRCLLPERASLCLWPLNNCLYRHCSQGGRSRTWWLKQVPGCICMSVLCSCTGRMKQALHSSKCWLGKLPLVSALGGKEGKGMEQRLSQPGCGSRKEINVPPKLFCFIVFVRTYVPLLV